MVLAPLRPTSAAPDGRCVHVTEVTVLVVDDQEAFRDAATTLVGATPGFRVVAAVDSGEAALDHVGVSPVDLVLLDVNLGGLSGIETCRCLRTGATPLAVVLMSGYQQSELPADVGALGVPFLEKDRLSPDILQQLWDGLSGAHRPDDR